MLFLPIPREDVATVAARGIKARVNGEPVEVEVDREVLRYRALHDGAEPGPWDERKIVQAVDDGKLVMFCCANAPGT